MKLKKYFFALLATLCLFSVASCGESGPKALKVFVGTESLSYYTSVLQEYARENNLPFAIEVSGGDTGGYADTFLRDTKKGADIFVVAHDNFAKLLSGSGSIAPITKKSLIDNMKETVDPVFQEVCYLSAGGATPKYYGVPIIRQSLVLYYNKSLFAGKEDKLNSWEGILEVATSKNKLATAYSGTDGFSYSHWLLAQPSNQAAKTKFGTYGTLELFADGNASACYAWGEDQQLIHKYAQEFTANKNGRNGSVAGTSKWEVDLQQGLLCTVIGGAWHEKTIASAWGPEGYGVTILPTFKVGANKEYEFRSGSFYDVKCLVKKKGSEYASYLDDIMEYLSSDEIQQGSYEQCNNLPASNNVQIKADDKLAKAQILQGQTAGMPQPFGYNEEFNPAYYVCGTGEAFVELHEGKAANDLVKTLKLICYTWSTGNTFDASLSDATLNEWVNNR